MRGIHGSAVGSDAIRAVLGATCKPHKLTEVKSNKATLGGVVRDVTAAIQAPGPKVEALFVGLGCNDLMSPQSNDVVSIYPPRLDRDLEDLALAMRQMVAPDGRAMILAGGDAAVWKRRSHWDGFMDRVHDALDRQEGIEVVPLEDAPAAILRMRLSSDGLHFASRQRGHKQGPLRRGLGQVVL